MHLNELFFSLRSGANRESKGEVGRFPGSGEASRLERLGPMVGWSRFVTKTLQIGILNPPRCSSGATRLHQQHQLLDEMHL